MKNRLHWIDSSRGLGMICVYIYHTGYNTPYHQVFDYFLIPIFFFVSGYLFNESRNIEDGLKRIYRRLFIPYVILGFLTGLKPSYLHMGGVVECLEKSIESLTLGISLWFVACLILMELIALLMGQMFRNMREKNVVISKIGIIVASSIFILLCRKITKEDYPELRIWCWYNAVCGIGYYYLGNLYRKYELSVNIFERHSGIIVVSYILIALFCSFGLGSHIDFASANFEEPFVCLILSWFALIAVVCFTKRIGAIGWIEQIGRDTLFLFAVNIWLIKSTIYCLSLLQIDSLIPNWMMGLLITLITIPIGQFMNKKVRKYAPFIIGEKK